MYRFNTDKKQEYIGSKNISDLAKQIGLSRTQLSRILCGRQNTRKSTAQSIALVNNKNMGDFFIEI